MVGCRGASDELLVGLGAAAMVCAFCVASEESIEVSMMSGSAAGLALGILGSISISPFPECLLCSPWCVVSALVLIVVVEVFMGQLSEKVCGVVGVRMRVALRRMERLNLNRLSSNLPACCAHEQVGTYVPCLPCNKGRRLFS